MLKLTFKPLTNLSVNNMIKFNKLIATLALGLSVILLSSCGGGAKKETSALSDEFEQAKTQLEENVKKVLHEIPSPAEIPFKLQAAGADFNGDIVNSIDNIDSYASNSDKAIINLGVYSTDIGYLSSYEKTQESLSYMRSCRKLADNLGLSSSFSPDLITEFEEKIESRDSLATLVNETIADSESLLREDDRGNLAALLVTGSFVEGLYLSTQIVENYPTDLGEEMVNMILSDLIRTIIEQEKPLNDLVAMLEGADQSDTVTSILASLAEIQTAYDGVDLDALIEKQKSPSAQTIKGITDSVAVLRNDLTS